MKSQMKTSIAEKTEFICGQLESIFRHFEVIDEMLNEVILLKMARGEEIEEDEVIILAQAEVINKSASVIKKVLNRISDKSCEIKPALSESNPTEILEKDFSGLLIYVDSSNETHTKVHMYKRKTTSYSCNIDTRMRIQKKDYMLLYSDDKDTIKKRRDQLIVICKDKIPSFKFVPYSGGCHVQIENDEFHLFEKIVDSFKKRFVE
jgi:hypothetical protein